MESDSDNRSLTTEPELMTPTLPYGVGIDTHKSFIQVCILYTTNNETLREEQEFQTSWPDLDKAVHWVKSTLTSKGVYDEKDPLRYTIESTGCYHLPVCMAFKGLPSVINPMLAGPTRRKTDVLDARTLAHHSIVGLWPVSYQVTTPGEILRCLLAMRNESSRNASRLINRLNNHLLRFGHTLGRDGPLSSMQARAILDDLCLGRVPLHPCIHPQGIPDTARPIFVTSLQQYDYYNLQKKEYHRLVLSFVKENEWPSSSGNISGRDLLENLCSVPGVGEVTALTWLSVIGDPRRFMNRKQVSAFCGSDPSVKVSAGKTTSHIRRKGNAVLHHVLKNCAARLVREHSDPIGQWGFALLKRNRKGGWGRAVSAVARRLSVYLWHVHRTSMPFDYEKYKFMDAPQVVDMPIEETNLHERYKKQMIELGLTTTSSVARAFMTSIPQQKGIGPSCLHALKELLHNLRVQPDQATSHPPTTAPSTKTLMTQFLSDSADKSLAETATTSPGSPTQKRARSSPKKKSATESPAKKPIPSSTISVPPATSKSTPSSTSRSSSERSKGATASPASPSPSPAKTNNKAKRSKS